jgi:hypothetical protein
MSTRTDPESKVWEIRRKTRRRYSTEEKIRIVLEGLKGEESPLMQRRAILGREHLIRQALERILGCGLDPSDETS